MPPVCYCRVGRTQQEPIKSLIFHIGPSWRPHLKIYLLQLDVHFSKYVKTLQLTDLQAIGLFLFNT